MLSGSTPLPFVGKYSRSTWLQSPPSTCVSIIQRGLTPDQRVLVSTLDNVCTALESLGTQRPPGMIVVGWALHGRGVRVLEEVAGSGEERVKQWLGRMS